MLGRQGLVSLVNWAAFVPVAVVVSLVPGANQLLSLRNAIRHGAWDASVALVGRFTAFLLLIGLVAVGLGALLAESAAVFAVVKWLGVAYLTWVGVGSLRSAARGGGGGAAAGSVERRTRGALV